MRSIMALLAVAAAASSAHAQIISNPVVTTFRPYAFTTVRPVPVTTYYAPFVTVQQAPVTTYYAPTTTYYAPTTTYYAPTTTYYAPTTTYYAPSVPAASDITTYYPPAAPRDPVTTTYYAPEVARTVYAVPEPADMVVAPTTMNATDETQSVLRVAVPESPTAVTTYYAPTTIVPVMTMYAPISAPVPTWYLRRGLFGRWYVAYQ